MENTAVMKPETGCEPTVTPLQCLDAVVLDSGRIAFEFQSSKEAVNSDRREIEKYLYQIKETDSHRAMLVLGLVDPSFCLSPSMEFWRKFCVDLRINPGIRESMESAFMAGC